MTTATQGLSSGMIHRIVNTYIGVSGGYLNGFSYRILDEFYSVYCDLDINSWDFGDGTTRARFIAVLEKSPPDIQAKILRGLLVMIPQATADVPRKMTQPEILQLVAQLEGLPVAAPRLPNAREVVIRALADAEALLDKQDATSAIDRLHTALHGYLRDLCDSGGIQYEGDPTAPRLLKLLRENHPASQAQTPRAEEVFKVLTAMGTAVDALGTIRNTASVAHANDALIDKADAMLVVNFTRSMLQYLALKLG